VLLAVLRAGSFSGAAQALGVEQSTISRRIAHLETELGQPLFDRQANGPQPTELCMHMRVHAERVEAEMRAIRDLAGAQGQGITGSVRIALTESFAVHVFLPYLLGPLREAYPALQIDLLVSSASADLGRREADIAVRFYRPTHGDLITKRVARLETAVLARRSYAAGRARDPAAYTWSVLELEQAQSLDAEFVERHAPHAPRMLTNSHLVQVESVRAGHAVALLARAHLALDAELIALDLGLPAAPAIEVWLASPRTRKSIARIHAVWEFLDERLAQLGEV